MFTTTYSKVNKSMDCPYCGKPLVESESQNEVACSDSKCKFNNLQF